LCLCLSALAVPMSAFANVALDYVSTFHVASDVSIKRNFFHCYDLGPLCE